MQEWSNIVADSREYIYKQHRLLHLCKRHLKTLAMILLVVLIQIRRHLSPFTHQQKGNHQKQKKLMFSFIAHVGGRVSEEKSSNAVCKMIKVVSNEKERVECLEKCRFMSCTWSVESSSLHWRMLLNQRGELSAFQLYQIVTVMIDGTLCP